MQAECQTVLRDYHMGFWLSPSISIWDSIISLHTLVDNGWGLILRMMTKTICSNPFTTYSNSLFGLSKRISFHTKTKKLCHEKHLMPRRVVVKCRTYGPSWAKLRQVRQVGNTHLCQTICPEFRLPVKLASLYRVCQQFCWSGKTC